MRNKFVKLLVGTTGAFAVALFCSCTNVGNSAVMADASPLEIARLPEIKLIAGKNMLIQVPIFNNSDKKISGIKYKIIPTAKNEPVVIDNSSSESCSNISANDYCMVKVLLPLLTNQQKQGAFLFQATSANFSDRQLVNFQELDRDISTPILVGDSDLFLSGKNQHIVNYVYNLSSSKNYRLTNVSAQGVGLSRNYSGIVLFADSVQPIIMRVDKSHEASLQIAYDQDTVSANRKLNSTARQISNSFAVNSQDGAILIAGNAELINSKVSDSSQFYIFNAGNIAATVASISLNNSNIVLSRESGDCVPSSVIEPAQICRIGYRVVNSLSGGSSQITVASNAGLTPSLVATAGWFNSNDAVLAEISSIDNNIEVNVKNFSTDINVQNIGGHPFHNGYLGVVYKSNGVESAVISGGQCAGEPLNPGEACNAKLNIQVNESGTQLVQLAYLYDSNNESRIQYYNYIFEYNNAVNMAVTQSGCYIESKGICYDNTNVTGGTGTDVMIKLTFTNLTQNTIESISLPLDSQQLFSNAGFSLSGNTCTTPILAGGKCIFSYQVPPSVESQQFIYRKAQNLDYTVNFSGSTAQTLSSPFKAGIHILNKTVKIESFGWQAVSGYRDFALTVDNVYSKTSGRKFYVDNLSSQFLSGTCQNEESTAQIHCIYKLTPTSGSADSNHKLYAVFGSSGAITSNTVDYQLHYVIFVTAASTNGSFGGMSGGNNLCDSDINKPEGTIAKVVQNNSTSAHSGANYYNLMGQFVATANGSGFTNTTLSNPIESRNYYVWVGTGSSDCNEWQSSDRTKSAVIGSATATTSSKWRNTGSHSCGLANRLYCVTR